METTTNTPSWTRRRYLVAATHYSGVFSSAEVTLSLSPVSEPRRYWAGNIEDLRAYVAHLRAQGHYPAKIGGGLNRVFAILSGKES